MIEVSKEAFYKAVGGPENRQAAYVECEPMRRASYEIVRLVWSLADAAKWFIRDDHAADFMRDNTPGIVWW